MLTHYIRNGGFVYSCITSLNDKLSPRNPFSSFRFLPSSCVHNFLSSFLVYLVISLHEYSTGRETRNRNLFCKFILQIYLCVTLPIRKNTRSSSCICNIANHSCCFQLSFDIVVSAYAWAPLSPCLLQKTIFNILSNSRQKILRHSLYKNILKQHKWIPILSLTVFPYVKYSNDVFIS